MTMQIVTIKPEWSDDDMSENKKRAELLSNMLNKLMQPEDREKWGVHIEASERDGTYHNNHPSGTYEVMSKDGFRFNLGYLGK